MSIDKKFIDLELNVIEDNKIKQHKMNYFIDRARSEMFLGLKKLSLKAYFLKQYFILFHNYNIKESFKN